MKKFSKSYILILFIPLFIAVLNAQMDDPILKSACNLIKEGKLDKAIKLLKKDLEYRPWNHDVRLYLGISYYLSNEKDLARKEFGKIEKEIEKMTGDARSFGDARIFLSMGMERKDRGVFSPENRGLFNFSYGLILKEKGEFKEAEKKLKSALKEGYNELQTRFQLMDLILKEKKFGKAYKELKSILKLTSENNEKILFIKGYILAKMKKMEDAVSCFEKILTFNPDCIPAKKNLGIILYNKENYHQAINVWSEILDKNPNEKDVIVNIGRAYFQLGRKEKAQEFFNEIKIKIPVEKYSPKIIPLLPPELDKKIEFDLTCK
ncbi:tetratricopeptide repeat protein [Candidatus Aminicenantes bacterium AH-873-B07]|nr:tetratricopeptide repeat protein [Candidatus Aminicenantes bacterium AH-873-B07]